MTPELRAPSHGAPDAPLRGVTVVELEGELTGYAGRLLYDLGADVTLVGTVNLICAAAVSSYDVCGSGQCTKHRSM